MGLICVTKDEDLITFQRTKINSKFVGKTVNFHFDIYIIYQTDLKIKFPDFWLKNGVVIKSWSNYVY